MTNEKVAASKEDHLADEDKVDASNDGVNEDLEFNPEILNGEMNGDENGLFKLRSQIDELGPSLRSPNKSG